MKARFIGSLALLHDNGRKASDEGSRAYEDDRKAAWIGRRGAFSLAGNRYTTEFADAADIAAYQG
jgi:hypothetical protein